MNNFRLTINKINEITLSTSEINMK